MKEGNMSSRREVGKFNFETGEKAGVGKIEKIENTEITIDMNDVKISEIQDIAAKLQAREADLKKLFLALGIPPVEAQYIIGKLGTPIDESDKTYLQ